MESATGHRLSIQLHDVDKTYNQDAVPVHAVRGVNLLIEAGEFVALMGPSGSGKTTLLNLIGGIDRPSRGEIQVNGVRLNALSDKQLIDFRRDHIGFVFQNYSLLPVLSAKENAEFIMQLQGRSDAECAQRALSLLRRVGLEAQAERRPAQLSGGQQQRAAVVRALAANPAVVLADEPTANLDGQAAAELLDIMQQLNREDGVTFIFSTHDPRVIDRARRVILFEDGQIQQDRRQMSLDEEK